jgi:hypothetical protein
MNERGAVCQGRKGEQRFKETIIPDRQDIQFQTHTASRVMAEIQENTGDFPDRADLQDILDGRFLDGPRHVFPDEKKRFPIRRDKQESVLGRPAEIEQIHALNHEQPIQIVLLHGRLDS